MNKQMTTQESANVQIDLLHEVINDCWMPSDSTSTNLIIDDDEIQRIYADLLTVENLTDLWPNSFSDFPEKDQYNFDKQYDSGSPSSGSMTPSPSSDDLDDESFNYQEWLRYDRSLCKHRAPKLLEFLYLLLENTRYNSYASWLDRSQGLFRIYKPDEVARLWRKVKVRRSNGSMNYDTFSRGIRYYYKSGLMIKTHTK
ncbi:unnamed protein product, partial [Adineta ricciae]